MELEPELLDSLATHSRRPFDFSASLGCMYSISSMFVFIKGSKGCHLTSVHEREGEKSERVEKADVRLLMFVLPEWEKKLTLEKWSAF